MKFSKKRFLCISLAITLVAIMSSCKNKTNKTNKKNGFSNTEQLFINTLDTAQVRYTTLLKQIENKAGSPRSLNNDGSLKMVDSNDWTSGFFPGSLWYLFEYSKNDFWKINADKYTRDLEEGKDRTNTHDLGFIYYCSYANAYRITGENYYKDVVLAASESLITRYNPTIGCIRSWDWGNWNYPVIIDNMMNLEMLFWASKTLNNSTYSDIAISHANNTLKNHFREDFSSCHVVDYDNSGNVIGQYTHQGAFDGSIWSRGQSWGLYGFTFCYRETRDSAYLSQAEDIADFIISELPEDYIPYWDMLAPNIPDEPRDASAAAVMASALIELSEYLPKKSEEYMNIARNILVELCSAKYLNTGEINYDFILLHSTGDYPQDHEIDAPLNYADYYFIEALVRYVKLQEKL
jgi:hypothetical protein